MMASTFHSTKFVYLKNTRMPSEHTSEHTSRKRRKPASAVAAMRRAMCQSASDVNTISKKHQPLDL